MLLPAGCACEEGYLPQLLVVNAVLKLMISSSSAVIAFTGMCINVYMCLLPQCYCIPTSKKKHPLNLQIKLSLTLVTFPVINFFNVWMFEMLKERRFTFFICSDVQISEASNEDAFV